MKFEIADKLGDIENEVIVAGASDNLRAKEYEHNLWPYIISAPLMYFLVGYVILKKFFYKLLGFSQPKINAMFFDGFGKNSRLVKEYAASWKALDIVYNHPFPCDKVS